MNIRRIIKVLVVDDSLLFRETLAKGIAKDPMIQVVGTAADPYEARDKILELEPDVMTLDVEMPKMNGIEFLKKLIPQYPMPVVVVSAIDGIVFDAMKAGAVDFVAKPDFRAKQGIESLILELITKIKIAATVKVDHIKIETESKRVLERRCEGKGKSLIAIGASTGGTDATESILKVLPKETPGILVVQHMPPVFTKLYAERLNKTCLLEVREAQNRDKIEAGLVLISPGDHHMRIKKIGKEYMVECFKGEKVNGHCPSVDVLFDSVAKHMGMDAIGLILTGMGADGAKGLLNMRKKGARTIGQDGKTSVVYGMPKVAYNIGAVEHQLPLRDIAAMIYSLSIK